MLSRVGIAERYALGESIDVPAGRLAVEPEVRLLDDVLGLGALPSIRYAIENSIRRSSA